MTSANQAAAEKPKTIYLKDYKKPDYKIESIELNLFSNEDFQIPVHIEIDLASITSSSFIKE